MHPRPTLGAPALGVLGFQLAAAVMAYPRDGLAQGSNRNPAASQALYDEARQLVVAGKFAEACPKFKESYDLDPGGGTLLNLADCYEKQGKTALSWTTFKEALVVAQRDGRRDRAEFASQHLAPLENRLARLTVQVAASARIPGLTIALDGSPLGDAAWGVAMPVDPGKHVVRAEAPGKRPFETSVEVSEANAVRESVDVPALADAPANQTSTTGAATVSPVESASGGGSSHALVGWVMGGAGVVAIGVGSYFGLHAFARWSDRNSDCAAGCNAAAKTAGDDAHQAATISDVAFGVGLAAVAVGAYLILTSHGGGGHEGAGATARLRVQPEVLARGGGLSLGARW